MNEGNELHVLKAEIAKSLLGIIGADLKRVASIGNGTFGRYG